MDIEGFEYQVIFNTPDSLLDQFRIMIVEFHFLDQLFDKFVFTQFSSCFDKILRNFYVAHIHPNNCEGCVTKGNIGVPKVLEITFLNKKRAASTKPRTDFPHRLDAECAQTLRPLPLPKCWFVDAP
jgi:hypothetical protein